MLEIYVPNNECFNESTREIMFFQGGYLQLEHSLFAISKWEMKYHKCYLNSENLTKEEQFDYVKFMTLNNPDPIIYSFLTEQNIIDINEYINDPATATVIQKSIDAEKNKDKLTSELMYYWLVANRIPFEVQYWHLNHMLALIDVCSLKNSPEKKHSKKQILDHYKDVNERNKKILRTKG